MQVQGTAGGDSVAGSAGKSGGGNHLEAGCTAGGQARNRRYDSVDRSAEGIHQGSVHADHGSGEGEGGESEDHPVRRRSRQEGSTQEEVVMEDWLAGESACPTKKTLPDGRGSDSFATVRDLFLGASDAVRVGIGGGGRRFRI